MGEVDENQLDHASAEDDQAAPANRPALEPFPQREERYGNQQPEHRNRCGGEESGTRNLAVMKESGEKREDFARRQRPEQESAGDAVKLCAKRKRRSGGRTFCFVAFFPTQIIHRKRHAEDQYHAAEERRKRGGVEKWNRRFRQKLPHRIESRQELTRNDRLKSD